jgi:integrase
MSNNSNSRAPFSLTLTGVLTAIDGAADLPKARRQDLASAVRTVARALARPPELIPADPVLLGRRLAEISPIALGVSKGRWANVRSLLLQALALSRPMLPGRHREPLSPPWAALHQALPCRAHAHRLSRLFHWLSARGVSPETVTAGDIEAFGAELREATLSKKPSQIWLGVCWAWNKAQRKVEGWPAVTLTIPKKRQPYTFPWAHFPASLKADVDCYLERLAGHDLLEDLPFRPVGAETVAFRDRQFRTFASALVHRGRDPDSLRGLADLVELNNFREALRFFLERNNNVSSLYIYNLAYTLKGIARHHVKADQTALDRMTAVIKRLEVPTKGLTRRNRDRLRPFDDPGNVQALIDLPQRLMKEAGSGKLSPHRAALLAQTAAAIEILLMAPVRLRNLLSLGFDQNLIWSGSTLHLVFEEHEVKNRRTIDIPLPRQSADLIKQYRDQHLPGLSAVSGQVKLFPGKDNGVKSRSTFRLQLSRTILRYTGLRMNPHLFRHARVKIHLDRHPGEYAIVSTALGHASIDTTRNFYAGFETAAAMQHFDEVILALRRKPGTQRSERP